MRVDIIIPTYKPDDTFCLLLQKLQEQTFVIHELILVNTEEALWNEAVRKYPIEQIRKELPFSSRIFHMTRENFDHGGARNMGAGYSEADILIFMTQDAVPADERLVEHLVHALTSGAHGPGTPAKGAVAVAYARQLPREDCGIIELWTKIPAASIRADEFEQLAGLGDRLRAHIIGQDTAIDTVCAAIRRNRVGLQAKRKPVSFLFVGGTGVGKTELVKRLADELFHAPESLIRLDMSEFMEKFSVSRMIGSPPGYVGYDEAGQLTEKIRRRPYSVVLFDEIEKAHPDVMNLLLQILDDGRITDAQGRTVNFENTVIILTTNAGSNTRTGTLGFGLSADDQSRERAQRALNEFLRPEFLNRLDEIVYFNHLTVENFRAIASLMLGEVRTAMAERGMTLHWTPAVVDYLVAKGYSETYGARNLRRTIQRDVEDAIASAVVAQRKAAGDVAIDAQNDRIVVTIDGKEVTA